MVLQKKYSKILFDCLFEYYNAVKTLLLAGLHKPLGSGVKKRKIAYNCEIIY